jgi:Arc/MetJ family transcription regulator
MMYAEASMRTTLNIDDAALADAMRFSKGKTKTEVVNEALRRFARAKRRLELLALRGTVEWEGDLDALRERS